MERELGFRKPEYQGDCKDALPQELSYLALIRDQGWEAWDAWRDADPDGQAPVWLLASDSPEGQFCANVIRRLLADSELRDKEPWSAFEVRDVAAIPGLRVDRSAESTKTGTESEVSLAEAFRLRGVPSLIRTIQQKAEEEPGRAVWLNVTGGFKGAIPYTTIASFFIPNVELHYLFEDTDRIIRLPRYPLGLDFPRWHGEANLLKAAGRESRYAPHLDERMQAVLSERNAAEGKPPAGSISAILEKAYHEQLGSDRFQEFSKRVIRQILPDRRFSWADDATASVRARLRERLIKVIEKAGHHIWLGDKLVLSVDHAGLHHHNLLEIAQCLLTPIADEPVDSRKDRADPRFLNDAERFVLLSAVLLHDSGHVIDCVPLHERIDPTGGDAAARAGQPMEPESLIPLARTEVRDFHHFLSRYRLNDPELSKQLGWERGQPYAEEAAWLCFYHRRRTGWAGPTKCKHYEPGHRYCPFLEISVPEPERLRTSAIESGEIDFLKLVALMRLIDGCDNQSRRTGPTLQSELMLRSFERDRKTWAARLLRLTSGLKADAWSTGSWKPGSSWWDSKTPPWKTAFRFAEIVREWAARNEASATGSEAFIESPDFNELVNPDPWTLRYAFARALALPEEQRPSGAQAAFMALWTELYHAFKEIEMHAGGELHAIKHQTVERVWLLPTPESDRKGGFDRNRWSFTVELRVNKNDAQYGKLDCDEFEEKWRSQMAKRKDGKIVKHRALRKWIESEIRTEMSSETIEHLRNAAGHPFEVIYRWSDKGEFARYPPERTQDGTS